MSRVDKTLVAVLASPLVLVLLAVSYRVYNDRQLVNEMKSVLAQSKAANMSTLSFSGAIGLSDPVFLIPLLESRAAYFHFDSCCSQQQFPKASLTFYKAGSITKDGQTYEGWTGPFPGYLPGHLAQGSFGEAEVKVQGKPYVFIVVNDTKAKKTTIIVRPYDD